MMHKELQASLTVLADESWFVGSRHTSVAFAVHAHDHQLGIAGHPHVLSCQDVWWFTAGSKPLSATYWMKFWSTHFAVANSGGLQQELVDCIGGP